MEIIKNYLEAMFKNLPLTEKVLKAKAELLQMMEDKYAELISQGKSENEAIGTVIAEFGKLEDLAQDLGIAEILEEKKSSQGQGTDQAAKRNQKKSTLEKILKTAYWPFITLLYFLISFLSSAWKGTWIIWLVASPIYALLMAPFSDKEDEEKSQKNEKQ